MLNDKTVFKNSEELKLLIQTIYPVDDNDEFWSKSVQLCAYVFGLAALDIKKGPATPKDIQLLLSKAYETNARKYLLFFCKNEKFTDENKVVFKEFYKNTKDILTGLVLSAIVGLKKINR